MRRLSPCIRGGLLLVLWWRFLIAILPAVLAALTDASTTTQNTALASAVPIIAGVTKILANPTVDALLKQYLPALATAPKQG